MPCCVHDFPSRVFPFCLAGCPATTVLPFPTYCRAGDFSLPQLKGQPTNHSLMHARTRRSGTVKYEGSSAYAIVPWLLLSRPVSGCRRLRLDGLALCCYWNTGGFSHCIVGWMPMTTEICSGSSPE